MHNSQRTIKMVKMAFFLIKNYNPQQPSCRSEGRGKKHYYILDLLAKRQLTNLYIRSRGGLKSPVHFHETSLRSSSNTIHRVSSTGVHADAIVKKKSISRANFFPENPPKFLWRQLEIRLRIKKWDLTNHNNLYEGSPEILNMGMVRTYEFVRCQRNCSIKRK